MVLKATVQKESPKQLLLQVTSEAPVRSVLQNRCSYKFRNIHRKTSVLESLFNKFQALRPYGLQLYLKETSTQVFSCEYGKRFTNSLFIEHPRLLVLSV